MFKFTNSTTALVAAAICTTSLFASPAAYAKDVTVSYADLDLSTSAGQKKLETRLNAAARSACDSSRIETGTLLPDPAIRACLANAKASVKQQMATVIEAARNERLGG